MFKMRVALLGVLALFITSGIMTSVASANGPAWKVNGTRLGPQVKKQIKLLAGPTELKAKVTLIAVTIKCGTSKVSNAYIEGNGQGAGLDGASGIIYEQCKVPVPANCKVAEPIRTVPIKSQLVTLAGGQQIDDLVAPTQGETFVEIKLENNGATCSVAGTFPVKGNVAALVKPEDKEVKQGEAGFPPELEFPEKPITEVKKEGGAAVKIGLKLGAEAASFSGKYEARLESGEPFGAFH
jgi:copper chaperone CopZ